MISRRVLKASLGAFILTELFSVTPMRAEMIKPEIWRPFDEISQKLPLAFSLNFVTGISYPPKDYYNTVRNEGCFGYVFERRQAPAGLRYVMPYFYPSNEKGKRENFKAFGRKRDAYGWYGFYGPSILLEHTAKLSQKYDEGFLPRWSLTETQAGDVSAYIPTNVISITDGQTFLEPDLYKGERPMINVGLSVPRMGARDQTKEMKEDSDRFKHEPAQFGEGEALFELDPDVSSKSKNVEGKSKKTEVKEQKRMSTDVDVLEDRVKVMPGSEIILPKGRRIMEKP